MKKIFFALFALLLAPTVDAQEFKVIPKAKLEYDVSSAGEYMTILHNPTDLSSPGSSVWMGRTMAGIGLEFRWRKASVHFDNETFIAEDFRKFYFTPIQSNYKVRLQYAFDKSKIKAYIEHACFHSIGSEKVGTQVEGHMINGYKGGYTRIGISYNY